MMPTPIDLRAYRLSRQQIPRVGYDVRTEFADRLTRLKDMEACMAGERPSDTEQGDTE
jgi:hypothetical protein